MPLAPVFGLQFIRQDDQALPVIAANMDVVGLIGPCSTADPVAFPINVPVLVFSNDIKTLSKLYDPVSGLTDGYLVDALNGINAQLAPLQIAAQVVIVRTAYGTAGVANLRLQQTIANIMGNSVLGTGVWAFKNCPNTLFCTPRLIIAPGYTGQMATSLDTLTTPVNGVGYQPNTAYAITFAFGAGETNQAQAVLPQAHAVSDANGGIDDANLVIDSYGAWLTVAPTATLPAPDGTSLAAAPATGEILFTVQPINGQTITLNGSSVSFVTTAPTGNQVAISPVDLATTVQNLLTFLNAGARTAPISNCTYSNATALGVLITNKTAGAAGNGFTIASSVVGASTSGPTLLGGHDAIVPVQGTLLVVIAPGANPVVSALSGGLLDALMGHAIVESAGTSMIDDENWRDTINSQRIIPLSGGVKVASPVDGSIIIMPFAPRVCGTLIARDFVTGYPFHSAANQPISGIIGPARTITFSLTDGATEGQNLLSANIGILVRGLIGVETAISSGGFVFIGTDNAGDDPLWQFYNVTRGRDFIELSLMPSLRVFLGRANIDRQTVANIIGTIRSFLSQLTALQQILGYSVNFQGTLNTPEEIRLGHLTVSFAAEEPPVLRRITTMSARYRPAIDALVTQLAQQLNFQG